MCLWFLSQLFIILIGFETKKLWQHLWWESNFIIHKLWKSDRSVYLESVHIPLWSCYNGGTAHSMLITKSVHGGCCSWIVDTGHLERKYSALVLLRTTCPWLMFLWPSLLPAFLRTMGVFMWPPGLPILWPLPQAPMTPLRFHPSTFFHLVITQNSDSVEITKPSFHSPPSAVCPLLRSSSNRPAVSQGLQTSCPLHFLLAISLSHFAYFLSRLDCISQSLGGSSFHLLVSPPRQIMISALPVSL